MSTSYKFDKRFWIVTLSALGMAAVTFSLGMWQLGRAAQKENISFDRKNAEPIRLSGRWLADQTLYIDNRQMKAKQGFFVVTPLQVSSHEYLWVERGWIARDFADRKKLQVIETPKNDVSILVRKLADPVRPKVLANNVASEYPIVQYLEVQSSIHARAGLTYKGYVQQLGASSEGMQRDWYEPSSGVDKHYGYAFQWFALSALLIGLYSWFQWIKR